MNVLIIEDEKALSESISTYLTSQEYTCDIAGDFATAMHKTEYNEYDCILLDITLPGGNGLKILEQIKKDKKKDKNHICITS